MSRNGKKDEIVRSKIKVKQNRFRNNRVISKNISKRGEEQGSVEDIVAKREEIGQTEVIKKGS